MMPTAADDLFARMCALYALPCRRIPEGDARTPDFHVEVGGCLVAVEIKQIESSDGYAPPHYCRTVGEAVRRKIEDGHGQLRAAAASGLATLLLIHNAVDPLEAWGTEPHDFAAAMRGALTVDIGPGGARGPIYHGRNATLRPGHRTAISAVGHLRRGGGSPYVELYPNPHAAVRLPVVQLPGCFRVIS